MYNQIYVKCKVYPQVHYFDCWNIIAEENRMFPLSYYYLYSKEEIAMMEEKVWQELEAKIKEV